MLPQLLFHLALAAAQPQPDKIDPADKYGCTIDEINDTRVVDARDINLPPHRWMVKVWAGKWASWLPKPHLNRTSALKACDQWMKGIEQEIRKELKNR